MTSVLLFERHAVDPGRVDDFRRLLEQLVDDLRTQPGALWADAARCMDDDPSFVVLSEWRTGADLAAWRTGERRRAFDAAADPLVRCDPTRRTFGS